MKVAIDAICAGGIAPMPRGKPSGIAKQPLEGSIAIGSRGIAADEQADRRHHGYPAMALHQFPRAHYDWLRVRFGSLPRLAGPGSMGENLSVGMIDEAQVHIGDRFRLGSALIELTQPRQPCATIERHLGTKGIVAAMVEAGISGWFYRVLEGGSASAGDNLERIETGSAQWPVRRAFLAVYGKNKVSRSELEELRSLPRVSDRLVRDIDKRLGLGAS
ncbi:MOSC domain-containing protein [Alteriqipengyuania flavescens]|uniref:MOSC domain-containing protein n=1 Tax=Alteriqipengyuania flavescens TaxID=3053610 RepID=UPI0025B51C91|nr:MOSC domain-containing protein [Alteriqipengyuania flavescens]WJY17990.1 MOSC domain-containing protein [Alteriqipengyuania flavescens]WJY23931.1 MOSC domain-containing protein [Alteriqipengyuania flavescens]